MLEVAHRTLKIITIIILHVFKNYIEKWQIFFKRSKSNFWR